MGTVEGKGWGVGKAWGVDIGEGGYWRDRSPSIKSEAN